MTDSDSDSDGRVHIFGYGSLVWRPAFAFEQKAFGFIRGWRRRFWQGSIDHRGIPESPGRVVTLLPDDGTFPPAEMYPGEEPIVWGVVYTISAATAAATLDYLDFREKNGYIRTRVGVYGSNDASNPIVKNAILYTAGSDNEHFLGPAPVHAIAETITKSVGPSGPNIDYLFQLVETLRSANIRDPHCEELYQAACKILGVDDSRNFYKARQ